MGKSKDGLAVVNSPEADAALVSLAPSKIREQGFEFCTDIQIPDGKTLIGRLIGEGEEADMSDPATGEVRAVRTWIVAGKGVTFRLLGGAHLNRLLADVIKAHGTGATVSITRLGQINLRSGRRMTEYAVGVKPGTGSGPAANQTEMDAP